MDIVGYRRKLTDAIYGIEPEVIEAVITALQEARRRGRRIFIMGNGGSGATASHMAGDLMKSVSWDGSLVICLNDNTAALTAWANDEDFKVAFVRQLEKVACAGDVVMVLSGSGQSPNIVGAVDKARELGCVTVALTGQVSGEDGGLAAVAADLAVVVPSDSMEIIEDVHLVIGHMVKTALRDALIAD